MSSSNSSLFTPHSLLKPTRWLITGGRGFIGTSLIKNLISDGGHFIRVLDNLSVGTRQDLAKVCDFSEKQKVKSEKSEKVKVKSEKSKKPSSPPEDSLLLTPNSSLNSDSSLLTSNSSLKNDSSLLTSNFSPTQPKVELLVGDIRDYSACYKCCQGIDIIVHLAVNTGVGPSVENPRKDMESNVMGTFNMLEAARHNGVKRFVFASSGAPVGECQPPIHEELAPHPVSPYGASKLAGEGYCSAYYRTFGVETIALRFGNVYGPGSGHKNSVVAKFIKQTMQGETLEIYGDGNQTRDFIYIDDLINAIRKAADFSLKDNSSLKNPNSSLLTPNFSLNSASSLLTPNSSLPFGEVFQIATNHESSINELVEQLLPIFKNYGYNDIKIINGGQRLGDVRRNFSDTTKAKKLLEWKANMNIETGLKQTVEWFLIQR